MLKITTLDANYETGTFNFHYELHDTPDGILHFTETLELSKTYSAYKPTLSVEKALQTIHIMLGVSYFKLTSPEKIEHPYSLSALEANFWNTIYTIGLGEFNYVNSLKNLHRTYFFEDAQKPFTTEHDRHEFIDLDSKYLVHHGGGKDSIVSVELLKKAGLDFDLFTVGTNTIQEDVAEEMGKKPFVVRRVFDSQLRELSKKEGYFNGHVPIVGIFGAISVLVTLLEKNRGIVVSHEASADYGHVEFDDVVINHQWDKSIEFEELFQRYLNSSVHPTLEYFSLLRPLHEIVIVKMFTDYPHYFQKFSSSNHNFLIFEDKKPKRWDVDYSKGKVEFIYALFAAFLPKTTLDDIFEEAVYEREDLLDIYKELLGLKSIKPLDCVGTPEETKAAMYLAYKRGELRDTPIMKYFTEEVLPDIQNPQDLIEQVVEYGNDILIPTHLHSIVRTSADAAVRDIMKLL